LDLRTLADALRGGDSGSPALSPGSPENSPLYLAVTREHGAWKAMPPKAEDALTADEREYLRAWIAAGAPWPDAARAAALRAEKNPWSADDGVIVQTSAGLSEAWTRRRYKKEDLWAYQPLKKPPVPPSPRGYAQGANPIDQFVNRELAKAGLEPAPRADRATLVRRVTFDLTGLPPSAADVESFINDAAPDRQAFARLVDRLLASPHYGEQMARHWLDVVRYADSSGFSNDYARGNAWRYRDYVIRAFNNDKPYDRFVREQIAGDELFPDNPEAFIATGFLRMGPWELTGMEVPRVARQRFLDDVTDSVGQTFLAHPLQCARCHDHKFDPIPTKDYYSIQAAFATTQMAEREARFLPEENTGGFEEKKYLDERAAHHRRVLGEIDAKSIAAARAWYADRNIDPEPFERALKEIDGDPNRARRDAVYGDVRSLLMKQGIPEDRVPPRHAGYTPADYGHERIARKGLERLRWELEKFDPYAFAVYSGRTPEMRSVNAPQRMRDDRMTAGELEQMHILTGGDPFANGPAVNPGVLSAATSLGQMNEDLARIPDTIEGRRAALARWIASPQNPLTARTYVNRVWQWHFGQAIAGNANNFGATGKKPTHPELLDWLAAEFVESGWDMKRLHRLLVTSEAYKMRSHSAPDDATGSSSDAENVAYWRFEPTRAEAEVIRDRLLRVAGVLDEKLGGAEIDHAQGLVSRRRSLYFTHHGESRMTFLELFDAADPCDCYRRPSSVVPQQALALANSELSAELSARLARELNAVGSPDAACCSDAAFVDAAFERVLCRAPSAGERALCGDFLARQAELANEGGEGLSPEERRARSRGGLIRALFNHSDFVTIR
jgi:Protein of unknown function (DUF1549)/Protein of unknown function (DUF1553)/Planctomycete cytochrome C